MVPVQSRDERSERNAEAVDMGLLQGAEVGRFLRSKQSAATAEGRSAASLEALLHLGSGPNLLEGFANLDYR